MDTNTIEKVKYGEGSVRQIGPTRWQLSFYDEQGRRRRESFKTEARARAELNKKVTLRDAGKLDPLDKRTTVDKLAASYNVYAAHSAPKSAYWINLVWRKHLEPYFGGWLAERVTTDKIEEYVEHRLKQGAKTSTVNRELQVFRAMFNRGAKARPAKINAVPVFPERLREPNPRSGWVDREQYEKLLATIPYQWLRALLAVAYTFGFRRGELVGLRVSQVDLKARIIYLLPGTTKNDRGRKVFMTDEVFNLISECVQGKQPGDPVFTWGDGTPVRDFRRTWRTIAKRAGFPGLLLHDMRRTAVRNMVRAGISKQIAKKISGHATDAVFDRYDITDDETDLANATQRIQTAANGHKLDKGQ